MAKAQMETGKPTTKVMGGTVGAAIASLLIWGLGEFNHAPPASIQVAITTVVTFVASYYISPAPGDTVVN